MATLTTSIPTVVDALLSQWRALNMTDADGTPVAVFDGFPGPQVPATYVQIGGFAEITASGAQDWHALGGPPANRNETYDIECLVFAYIGGADATDTTSTSDAQQAARNQALSTLQQLEVAVRADPKLTVPIGGNGLGTGWVGFGTRIELQQSWAGSTDHNIEKGRAAVFTFQIQVFKVLFGS